MSLSDPRPLSYLPDIVPVRIAIDCLNCGHASSVAEDRLPAFGMDRFTSLVTLTRRLVCRECGSKAVKAQRYDVQAPPLAPNE